MEDGGSGDHVSGHTRAGGKRKGSEVPRGDDRKRKPAETVDEQLDVSYDRLVSWNRIRI